MARHPQMRRALIAYFVFSCVEWAAWIIVLVYARAVGEPTTLGFVAVAQLIPAALLTPFLASRLDRLRRGAVVFSAYASIAVALVAATTAMLARAPLVVVVGLAAVATVVVGMGRPAHHSVSPLLVRTPADLVAATVVATSAEGLGLFVGPAVVGVVMGLASPAIAMLVTAGAMSAAAIAVLGLQVPEHDRPRPAAHLEPERSGRRQRAERSPRLPIILGGMGGMVAGALDVLIVLLAIDVLGAGDSGVGYLNALVGVGALVGGFFSASLVGRHKLAPPLLLGVVAMGLAMVLVALAPAASLFLGLLGVGTSVSIVANRTMLQRLTPIPIMGTAFGRLEAASLLGLGVGALTAPFISEAYGVPWAFAAFGLAMPLVAIAMWPRLRRADASVAVPLRAIECLRRVDVVAGLSPEVIEALARSSTVGSAQAGTVIVTQGDPGEEMFVIDSGSVGVSRDGVEVATLQQGDVFGEIAVLTGLPRIATVTAREPTTYLAVGRDAVIAALATEPSSRSAIEQLAAARAAETLGDTG